MTALPTVLHTTERLLKQGIERLREELRNAALPIEVDWFESVYRQSDGTFADFGVDGFFPEPASPRRSLTLYFSARLEGDSVLLEGADLRWTDPSCVTEIEWLGLPLLLDEDSVRSVNRVIPSLLEAFGRAGRRGDWTHHRSYVTHDGAPPPDPRERA